MIRLGISFLHICKLLPRQCQNHCCLPASEFVQLFWEAAELSSKAGLATAPQFLSASFFYEGAEKLIKPALFSEFRFLNDVTPTAGRWPRPSASMLYYNNNKGSFQQLCFFFEQIVVTPGRQSLLSPVAPALCKQQLKRNPPPPEEKFSKKLERKNPETPLVKEGLLPRGGRSWPSC